MGQPIEIPNKSHFKLDEVCSLTGVKPYVLRFWETEFEEINPLVSSSGQKLFEHKDIESIAIIKKFLFDDKMSIEKAKREIKLYQSTAVSTYPEEEVSVEEAAPVVTRATLANNDIEKLVLAKQKLGAIVNFTNTLKETHNWN